VRKNEVYGRVAAAYVGYTAPFLSLPPLAAASWFRVHLETNCL